MDSVESGDVVDQIGIERIMELIPHRYPFLLIDRMVDIVPGESATGIKNVTVNEPCFQGHFPGHPIMPGVLIVESMAQTSAALVMQTLGKDVEGRVVYFMSVEGARFRKPVTPGDVMRINVKKQARRGNVWKFQGEATVEGNVVAEATYTAMIME
tara:strand:- start:537 stop:1001 length:465 start_codon:yes stop_codon:yes gene_type:complete